MYNNAIWDLNLHRECKIGEDSYVMRVPGGWIYSFACLDDNEERVGMTATFVPYSEEFK